MYNPPDDPMGKKIVGCFGPHRDQWRTLGGIERATGLSLNEVASYIEHNGNLFQQSPLSPSGIPLYSLNTEEKLF